MSKLKPKLLIFIALALLVLGNGVTQAKNSYAKKYGYSSTPYSSYSKSNKSTYNNQHSYKQRSYAQNNLRSRSDVMNEVKQRYNAKVLKISLNEQAGVYRVRILMPNGKVRSIQVNAR